MLKQKKTQALLYFPPLTDLKYMVDYEYDSYYPCQHGSGCCDDDYCRCCEISNVRITNVPINYFVEFLCGKAKKNLSKEENKKDTILRYCVDRILRLHQIYDNNNFDTSVRDDYYGQEVGTIYLKQNCCNIINTSLSQLKSLPDIDKIKFVLELEYGYLLDKIKTSTLLVIVEVTGSDIIHSNGEYIKKIKQDDVYKDYNLPMAVCVSEGKKYKIIDGYHRISYIRNSKQKSFNIIVLK